MADDVGGESSLMRAVATLLIIVLVVAVLYFSGILGGRASDSNSNIKTLSAPADNNR